MVHRFLFLLFCFVLVVPAGGQASGALSPLYPGIRTGTLENGVRFFLLSNEKPEKRVEMRLVVQAGSLQELPHEAGLAHLVEHLQFEGTQRFRPQEIIDFLETNGMRFGADLNAMTTTTDTQYLLNLPTADPAVLKKGLAILEDWAHGPVVTAESLAKEKKIVGEESRLRTQNVQGRAQEFIFRSIYANSAYEGHLPLGEMDKVNAFTPDDVRRFVDRWYTPRAMSLVIVGTIDPEAMEKTLRETFREGFPNLGLPGPGPVPFPPAVTSNSVQYFKDKELGNGAYIWWRVLDVGATTMESKERFDAMAQIALGALQKRLDSLTRQAGTGLMGTAILPQWSTEGHVELYSIAVPREGQTKVAIKTFLTELQKAATFGVTASEFDQGMKAFHDGNWANHTQSANTLNNQKAQAIASWIVTGRPVPFTPQLFEFRQTLETSVTREDVNALLARFIVPTPARLLVQVMDKPGAEFLTTQELEELRVQALGAPVTANTERTKHPLIEAVPPRGQVVKTRSIPGTPLTQWTLSNGIQVYLFKNSLTKNDFLLRAFAPGGLSLLSDADVLNGSLAEFLVSQDGVGALNASEVQDFLSGMKASVRLSLEDSQAVISGTTDPADPVDMEKFFQLLYKKLTAPRRDPEAEKALLANVSQAVRNNEHQPNVLFQNSLNSLLTSGAPRNAPLTSARLDELNPDRAAALLQSFFGDPRTFTCVITGDYNEANLKDLVESWLASVPALSPSDPPVLGAAVDRGIRPVPGPVTKITMAGHDNKAVITLAMENPYPYSAKNWHISTVLTEVLNIRLREVLRQDKGGTYGVETRINLGPTPYPRTQVFVNFTCALENQDAMVQSLKDELRRISRGDFADEVFAKALEIRRQTLETSEKTNSYWMDSIYWTLVHGDNLGDIAHGQDFYTAIRKDDVVALAEKALTTDQALVTILNPE